MVFLEDSQSFPGAMFNMAGCQVWSVEWWWSYSIKGLDSFLSCLVYRWKGCVCFDFCCTGSNAQAFEHISQVFLPCAAAVVRVRSRFSKSTTVYTHFWQRNKRAQGISSSVFSFNHWLFLKTLIFFHVWYELESFCILSDRLMSLCGCLVRCVGVCVCSMHMRWKQCVHTAQMAVRGSTEKWVLRPFLGLSGLCMVNILPAKPFLWPQTDDSYPVFTFRILCFTFQLCVP